MRQPHARAWRPGAFSVWRLLLVAVCAGLLGLSAGSDPGPAQRPPGWLLAHPSARSASPCTPPPPYSHQLAEIVEAEVSDEAGTYGVAVRDLDTGETYLRNGDQSFPAASVYKLAVLYETWRRVRLGELSPTARLTIAPADEIEPEPAGGPDVGSTITVEQALESMVTISSNASAHALLRLLGRGSINRSVEVLGLWDTTLPAPGTRTGIADVDGAEVAVTSPRDELCLLTLMAEGQLLGPRVSAEMRQLLLRQRINDRLPALLPPDARVAHKTGELPGVRNDVGIVDARQGTYVVVVLARGVDEGDATAAIARLSRRLYDHFAGTKP